MSFIPNEAKAVLIIFSNFSLYTIVTNSPINFVDPWGLKVIYERGEISNPDVRQKLETLDDMLPGSDVIVTGGDRYRDPSGDIRETLDDKLINNSALDSTHLSGHGVDFYIPNMSLDLEVLKDVGFDWIKYYKDGHYHGDIRKSGAECTPTGVQ